MFVLRFWEHSCEERIHWNTLFAKFSNSSNSYHTLRRSHFYTQKVTTLCEDYIIHLGLIASVMTTKHWLINSTKSASSKCMEQTHAMCSSFIFERELAGQGLSIWTLEQWFSNIKALVLPPWIAILKKIKELAHRTYPEWGSFVKSVRSLRETSKTWKLKLFIFWKCSKIWILRFFDSESFQKPAVLIIFRIKKKTWNQRFFHSEFFSKTHNHRL